MDETKFESWCIVEVMGHSRYAGFVTEQAVGGCSFVRVDVPEIPAESGCDARPAFTKLLSQGSIFCITPCTEETARRAARSFHVQAFAVFEMPVAARQAQLGYDPPDRRPPDDEDSEEDLRMPF